MTSLTSCDLKSTRELLENINTIASQIKQKVEIVTDRLKNDELNTINGLSFLDMKCQLLGQYNVDIANVVARKVNGQKLEESDCVDRLIQLRTYMERTKPIEHKLKYQIEKLIRIAASGGLSENDPLHFKPNPSNMVSKLDEANITSGEEDSDEEEDTDKNESKSTSGVYRPPMMTAAYFEENVTSKEKQDAAVAKAKKRALQTAMMRDLQQEYQEGPEEIQDDINIHRIRQSREEKHKIAYEEDNFLRLNVTKKEKLQQRKIVTDASLKELARFGDISALTDGADYTAPSKKRKSKTKTPKGKKKKFYKG